MVGCTPICELNRYVPREKVWFLSFSGILFGTVILGKG